MKIKPSQPKETSEQSYFRSSDFYLCCFLSARGNAVIDIDRANPRRAVFVFDDSLELQHDIQDFINHRASVNPRDFASAIKDLKQQLYAELP